MFFCTIGYEGVSIDLFLSCLKENGIQILLDVRQIPLSRKPGFSQKKLIERTGSINIVYKHIKPLGCPTAVRDAYKTNGDWNEYTKDYNLHLEDNSAALDKVFIYLQNFKCALMCFEANPERCHRSIIAQALINQHPNIYVRNLAPLEFKKEWIGVPAPSFA